MSSAPLLTFYLIFIITLFVCGIVSYLLKGFGMYGIAKRNNIPNAWLAFIPVASNYLQGRLAGESIMIGQKEWKRPALWMLLAPIIYSVLVLGVYFFYVFQLIILAMNGQLDGSPAAALEMMGSMIGLLIFLIIIGLVGGTLINLIRGLVRYNIHKKYQDDNKALMHMLLGLFIPLYQSIYFFILRDRQPLYYDELPKPE